MTESECNAIRTFIAWLNTPTTSRLTSSADPDEVLAAYLADTGQTMRPDVRISDMTFSATQMDAIAGEIWAEFERLDAEAKAKRRAA